MVWTTVTSMQQARDSAEHKVLMADACSSALRSFSYDSCPSQTESWDQYQGPAPCSSRGGEEPPAPGKVVGGELVHSGGALLEEHAVLVGEGEEGGEQGAERGKQHLEEQQTRDVIACCNVPLRAPLPPQQARDQRHRYLHTSKSSTVSTQVGAGSTTCRHQG